MQQEQGLCLSVRAVLVQNRNQRGKREQYFRPARQDETSCQYHLSKRQYYIYSVFHFLYITPDSRKSICRDQTSRVVQIVTGSELLPATYHILKVLRYQAYIALVCRERFLCFNIISTTTIVEILLEITVLNNEMLS